MNSSELKLFRESLPFYLLHLRDNPDSLIARIYGIFTVQMEDIAPVNLLLMANCCQAGKDIQYVFDLKGSTINREEKNAEAGTFKDVNLTKLIKKEAFLKFQQGDMVSIIRRMREDVKFLCSNYIMDYSLLLVIEVNKDWTDRRKRRVKKKE